MKKKDKDIDIQIKNKVNDNSQNDKKKGEKKESNGSKDNKDNKGMSSDKIIAKEKSKGKVENNTKNNTKSNIYCIYLVLFVVLIIMLLVTSSKDNFSNNKTNRKNVPNLEKTRESLSKNVKNAENNSDSEDLSTKKEVHESNKDKSEDDKDKKNVKKVFLTFDDGPTENTAKILSILKEHNAKATFFVVHHKGEKSKKLYRRIVDEGHAIGVHSYTHNYKKIYASEKAFKQDVLKMRNYIKDITGEDTRLYRFPGGSGNTVSKISIKKCIKVLNKESMIYYDWNVENGDATGKKISDKQLINNVVKNVKKKNTPIVLMHDTETKDATVKTLPKVITSLQKQGYEFVAINEDTPRIQQRK